MWCDSKWFHIWIPSIQVLESGVIDTVMHYLPTVLARYRYYKDTTIPVSIE